MATETLERIPAPLLLLGGPLLGLCYIMLLPLAVTSAIAGGLARKAAALWKDEASRLAAKAAAPHSLIP